MAKKEEQLQLQVSKPEKKIQFDPEKCNELYTDLVEVFQKHKPTVGEILIAYGNLGYALGASIGGFSEKGPGIEELKKLYYSEPGRLDIALMTQGLTVTTWYDDWEKQVLDTEDTKKE
jgi:hypothetical protein